MADWVTPAFSTLPDAAGSECRWVGTNLMDEEQYRTERWQRMVKEATDFSSDVPRVIRVEYWRASVDGMVDYGKLRRGRRQQRKRIWQEREEQDQAYTEWVNTLEGVQ